MLEMPGFEVWPTCWGLQIGYAQSHFNAVFVDLAILAHEHDLHVHRRRAIARHVVTPLPDGAPHRAIAFDVDLSRLAADNRQRCNRPAAGQPEPTASAIIAASPTGTRGILRVLRAVDSRRVPHCTVAAAPGKPPNAPAVRIQARLGAARLGSGIELTQPLPGRIEHANTHSSRSP